MVESVKAASDILSPVTGEVLEVNPAIVSDPGLVNSDPMGAGWFFKVRIEQTSELADLMDESQYAAARQLDTISGSPDSDSSTDSSLARTMIRPLESSVVTAMACRDAPRHNIAPMTAGNVVLRRIMITGPTALSRETRTTSRNHRPPRNQRRSIEARRARPSGQSARLLARNRSPRYRNARTVRLSVRRTRRTSRRRRPTEFPGRPARRNDARA